jgi:hypothetical protein
MGRSKFAADGGTRRQLAARAFTLAQLAEVLECREASVETPDVPASCYMLSADLRHDVARFGQQHCRPTDYVMAGTDDAVVVAFFDEDRAMLFLNLFDGDIRHAFEVAKGAEHAA